ncbi:MAG: ABC transporter permease [Calditrichaeota bacterium]|nr:MAG: ABC transporter permease [Calditrichota bacterium]
MKLFFLLKEGLAGFQRARLSATITIVTVTLSLTLIGMFGLIVQNLSHSFQQLYNKIQLEVFIDPSLSSSQVDSLARYLNSLDGVGYVNYITPQHALKEFESDFGDILSVLDANPFPPSFRVVLKGGYRKMNEIESIVRKIEALEEVDEVNYQRNIIRLMNKYFLLGVIITSAVGATIFFISTMLIFNTIRLTIHSRRNLISIMRLVGATRLFIKGPFVVEGILQGLLGSLFACGLLWLGVDIIRTALFPTLHIPLYYYGFLILTGTMLGLIGSYISIGKYLKY